MAYRPQFGVRSLFCITTAVAFVLLLFVPYSVQISPAVHVQFVDDQGVGIQGFSAIRFGGRYGHEIDDGGESDTDGNIDLPPLWARVTIMERLRHSASGLRVLLSGVGFFDPECITGKSDTYLEPGRIRTWKLSDGVWRLTLEEGGNVFSWPDRVELQTDCMSATSTARNRLVFTPWERARVRRMMRSIPQNGADRQAQGD